MSNHNIGFYEEKSKIIPYHQKSSNAHLIPSSEVDSTLTQQTSRMCRLIGPLNCSPTQEAGFLYLNSLIKPLFVGHITNRGPW